MLLDKRQFESKCKNCKHKDTEMVWIQFRMSIYKDYPMPCKQCMLEPFATCFEEKLKEE